MIEVREAEEGDLGPLAELFEVEYGRGAQFWERDLRHLLFSDYQHGRAVAMVAVVDGDAAALECLVAWPLRAGGRELRSLQSCRSLVGARARGKGVFGALLEAAMKASAERGVDLLFGFPNPSSLGSFVRSGWTQVQSSTVFMRPLSARARVAAPALRRRQPQRADDLPSDPLAATAVTADRQNGFGTWRAGLLDGSLYHTVFEGDGVAGRACEMKVLEHKFGFRECVVGWMREPAGTALDAVVAAARTIGADAVSIAVDEATSWPVETPTVARPWLRTSRMRSLVVYAPNPSIALDELSWRIWPADADTW